MTRARDLAKGTFSGDLTVDTNTLVVDSANNRVGVGTASPDVFSRGDSKTLGIQGATTASLGVNAASGSIASIYVGQNGVRAGQIVGASGSMTINAGSSNYLSLGTDFTERMKIDSAGRVTMPYQPAFSAVRETSSPSDSDVILPSIWANVGSHYNTANGRFTCPVAGTYMFSCSGLAQPTGSTSRWTIKLNGTLRRSSESRQQGSTVGAYLYGTIQTIITLSANDYVTMYYFNDDGSTALYSDASPYITFSGHLIG